MGANFFSLLILSSENYIEREDKIVVEIVLIWPEAHSKM